MGVAITPIGRAVTRHVRVRFLAEIRTLSEIRPISGQGAERRAVLAQALEGALDQPGDQVLLSFARFAPHAAELDRRGFVMLFGRALRRLTRHWRRALLVEEEEGSVPSGLVVEALDTLGGDEVIEPRQRPLRVEARPAAKRLSSTCAMLGYVRPRPQSHEVMRSPPPRLDRGRMLRSSN